MDVDLVADVGVNDEVDPFALVEVRSLIPPTGLPFLITIVGTLPLALLDLLVPLSLFFNTTKRTIATTTIAAPTTAREVFDFIPAPSLVSTLPRIYREVLSAPERIAFGDAPTAGQHRSAGPADWD